MHSTTVTRSFIRRRPATKTMPPSPGADAKRLPPPPPPGPDAKRLPPPPAPDAERLLPPPPGPDAKRLPPPPAPGAERLPPPPPRPDAKPLPPPTPAVLPILEDGPAVPEHSSAIDGFLAKFSGANPPELSGEKDLVELAASKIEQFANAYELAQTVDKDRTGLDLDERSGSVAYNFDSPVHGTNHQLYGRQLDSETGGNILGFTRDKAKGIEVTDQFSMMPNGDLQIFTAKEENGNFLSGESAKMIVSAHTGEVTDISSRGTITTF